MFSKLFFLFLNFFVFTKIKFSENTGSWTIDEAFVEGFKTNLYMLSQQKDARLFGKSRVEMQNSETDYYDRIAEASEPSDITTRHGDTPLFDIEHSRRGVTLSDAEWATMIDRKDKVRLLIEPTSSYVQSAIATLNRKKDDIFIAAALGSALAGKKGTSLVALPDTQKIVALDSAGSVSNLNVLTLTRTLEKFDGADIDEGVKKYFALGSSQKRSLLNTTEYTSADYATVKALARGELNDFMSFEFVRLERLPVTAATEAYDASGQVISGGANTLSAGARRCIAWCEDGMVSSVGEDLFVRVDGRPDKRYSVQAYASHSVGAVRMEEEKVIEVLCTES